MFHAHSKSGSLADLTVRPAPKLGVRVCLGVRWANVLSLILLASAGAFAGENGVRITVTDAGSTLGVQPVSSRTATPVKRRAEPVATRQAGTPKTVQSPVSPVLDNEVVRVPAPAVANPAEPVDNVDLGIRPIGSLTVDIALPKTQEAQNLQVPLPPDAASSYFQQFPAAPPGNPAYIPWMFDNSYDRPLNFCYRPLYFEDVNLERYGYSWGVWQPAVSTVKFCANTILLPYRMITQPPCKCTYHAHLSKPGGPAPRERQVPKGPLARFKD